MTLALSAFECNTVNKALEVDIGDILLLSGSVCNLNNSCELLPCSVYLSVNKRLGNSRKLSLSGKTCITLDLYLRLNKAVCLKYNVTLVRNEIKRGIANNGDARFLNSCLECFGNACVDSVLEEDALAVKSFDDSLGCLALSEAGNVDVLNRLLICCELCLVVNLLGYGKLHSEAGLFGKLKFDKTHCFFLRKSSYILKTNIFYTKE